MGFADYLRETYGTNVPIFSNEITFQDYSRPWIFKQLNQLCQDGSLIRYEKGVYYIPTETVFGKSLLDPRKVIERKYIANNGQIMGYYSGLTFQNQLQLTTQMPNVIELYTNNENTRARNVLVGKQKVLLRKARTEITAQNASVLSFLELMNDIRAEELDDTQRQILTRFVKERAISREDISRYAAVFPDRAMRNLIESEAIYCVAQQSGIV